MKNYELTLVLSPEATPENQKKLITKIQKLIEEAKGKVEKTADWGRKELAYPIAKKNFAYYHWLTFLVPPEAILAIDKKLKSDDNILRYLLVKTEEPAFANLPVGKAGATAGKEKKHGTKIAQ